MMPEIDNIMSAWRKNNFKFDAFLLGYLGSSKIMKAAKICFRDFSNESAKIVIDPAFGDNGRLYPAFDNIYVDAMADLIKSADILLPNVTEVCFLTDIEYQSNTSVESARKIVKKLADRTPASIILTGIESDDKIGELIYSEGEFSEVWAKKLPHHFHGTGDLFASVFTAVYLRTGNLAKSCEEAGNFVASSICATDTTHTYGVNFEYVLNNIK